MTLSHLYRISNKGVISKKNITSRGCKHFSKEKSSRSRIKQVATVSLIFLSMVTGEIFAGDKLPKSKASAGRKKEFAFEEITLTNSLLDIVHTFPLPDLVPVPPTPPVVSAILYLLGSASSSAAPKQNTGFMQIIG